MTFSGNLLNINGSFTFIGTNPLNTGSGAVTLSANSTVTESTGTLTVGATISGSGGLTTSGTGMTILAASNSYTGNTGIAEGTLQFGATGAIPTGAGTGNVVFTSAGASAVLDLGGSNATINGLSQPNASTTNVVVNNFAGAGQVTLSAGNNNATSTFGGVLADNNNGFGGTLALTKIGTGMLTLGGTNTYSGATTINGGTLALSAGGSLPSTSTVNFTGNATFGVGNSQAIVGLAVADSFTGTVAGYPLAGLGSLTVNATGSMLIGGANPNQTETLVMSSLGAFAYNGGSYTFDVGAEYAGSSSTLSSAGAGTVFLAASNTITASVFGVASNGSQDEVTTNVSTGLAYLGQSNVINASAFQVANNGNTNQRTSTGGTLQFAAGSVNPTLAIYGTGGPGNRTEITVGNNGNTSYSQYATGLVDLVTGVTGNSVLTAYVDQMILGQHPWYNNGHPSTGTFNMGGGTLDANSITLGDFTAGRSPAAAPPARSRLTAARCWRARSRWACSPRARPGVPAGRSTSTAACLARTRFRAEPAAPPSTGRAAPSPTTTRSTVSAVTRPKAASRSAFPRSR